MNSLTLSTLAELEKVEWFNSVGIETSDLEAVKSLSSWGEAIDYCSGRQWEDLELEMANQLREHLLAVSLDRFRKWNEIVDSIKPVTVPLVQLKVERVVRVNSLPKLFVDCVQWDILHMAMECEYSDVVEPGFFSRLANYYLRGRFPCGWEGNYPNGRLVVY